MPSKTPSGRNSNACWDFERHVAEAYRKAGFFKAERIVRGSDFGASRPDVNVPEVPGSVLDMKYRAGGWSHHGIFKAEIHERYLKGRPEKFGVMHTKAGREVGSFVTVTLETWLTVLARAYLRNQRSDVWSCPRCGEEVAKCSTGMPNLFSYHCSSCGLSFLSEDNHGPLTK